MYLIGYIAYGLHLWYKISIFAEIYRKPISLHPGLATSLHNSKTTALADLGSEKHHNKSTLVRKYTLGGGLDSKSQTKYYNIATQSNRCIKHDLYLALQQIILFVAFHLFVVIAHVRNPRISKTMKKRPPENHSKAIIQRQQTAA